MSEYTLDGLLERVEAEAARIDDAAVAVGESGRAEQPCVVEDLLALRNASDDLARYLWDAENKSGVGHDEALDEVWNRRSPYHDMHDLVTLVLATERAINGPYEGVAGGYGDRWWACRWAADILVENLRTWVFETRRELRWVKELAHV